MKKNLAKKIIAIITIGFLNWSGVAGVFGIFAVSPAHAYFSHQEISERNTFSTGTLDLALQYISNWEPKDTAAALKVGDSVEKSLQVNNAGTLDFDYGIKSEITSAAGDAAFCDSLLVEADLGLIKEYSGLLKDFDARPFLLAAGVPNDNWKFTVSLPAGSTQFQGLQCDFKFVFDAWQTNIPKGQGFFDSEEDVNNIKDGVYDTDLSVAPDSADSVDSAATSDETISNETIPSDTPAVVEPTPTPEIDSLAPQSGPAGDLVPTGDNQTETSQEVPEAPGDAILTPSEPIESQEGNPEVQGQAGTEDQILPPTNESSLSPSETPAPIIENQPASDSTINAVVGDSAVASDSVAASDPAPTTAPETQAPVASDSVSE